MIKAGLTVSCLLLFLASGSAQHLTGYYESEPQMENYDHFKIHHKQDELEVKAYIGSGELWTTVATEITDDQADYFIKKYGIGKEITSVHVVKIVFDGLDWEFFLLAHQDERGKNSFVVVEEIFLDESEEELLEVHSFQWSHKHHRG